MFEGFKAKSMNSNYALYIAKTGALKAPIRKKAKKGILIPAWWNTPAAANKSNSQPTVCPAWIISSMIRDLLTDPRIGEEDYLWFNDDPTSGSPAE